MTRRVEEVGRATGARLQGVLFFREDPAFAAVGVPSVEDFGDEFVTELAGSAWRR